MLRHARSSVPAGVRRVRPPPHELSRSPRALEQRSSTTSRASETLVAALGHPERACPTVLIAGTNGKGSVAAMVERALRAAGLRTGRYTSPHLVQPEERIAIDGAAGRRPPPSRPPSRDVLGGRSRLPRRRPPAPSTATFFEAMTAVGLRAAPPGAAVDVARASKSASAAGSTRRTSVIPMATAIVSIDLDHQRAARPHPRRRSPPRRPASRAPACRWSSATSPTRRSTWSCAAAGRVGAPLVYAAEGVECVVSGAADGRLTVTLDTATRTYGPVRLALAGAHQAANAFVAVRAARGARRRRASTSIARAVETGLATARWPGRLDRVALAGGRRALLDAAHNAGGGARPRQPRCATGAAGPAPPLVFAASADKDVAGDDRARWRRWSATSSSRPSPTRARSRRRARPIACARALATATGPDRAARVRACGHARRRRSPWRGARPGDRRRRIDLPARRGLPAPRPSRSRSRIPAWASEPHGSAILRRRARSCQPSAVRLARGARSSRSRRSRCAPGDARPRCRRRRPPSDVRARLRRRGRSASACTTSATRARSRSSWYRRASASRPTSPTTTTTSTGWSRSATSCSSPQSSRISADRAEFDTQGADRHLLQRLRLGLGQRQGRPELLRHARSPTPSSTARRSRRSASTATASRKGGFTTCVQPTPRWEVAAEHGHADRRQARHPEERRPEGQGRAAVLPAGDVLPDQQGGPLDRLPAAGLRHLDLSAARRSATPSSGPSTAART